MFVGEQPGDAEDLAGHPFVGPSGKLLDRVLVEAGIDRGDIYLTNAVKHFKWERGEKGKRRIHKTPNAGEIRACHPWLEQEIALVKPEIIVILGAIAAKALLGNSFSVMASRGKVVKGPGGQKMIASVHPSAVLRAPPDARTDAEKEFLGDMRKVARQLAKL